MSRLIQYIHAHKSIPRFSVYHNDLPTNDFNALLKNLGSSTHDYRHIPDCQVFVQLLPSSFFQQILPDQWVDLGFSMAAVHWLNRIPPSNYKDAVFLSDANEQAQADLLNQAAKDLQLFAKARTNEIKPRGLLFILGLASKVGSSGRRDISTAGLFVVVKKILTKLVADRLLSQEALDKFVFPVVPRTEEEFLKPFMTGELSGDWHCLHCSIEEGIAVNYVAYKKHRDVKRYAAEYTQFFRSFSPHRSPIWRVGRIWADFYDFTALDCRLGSISARAQIISPLTERDWRLFEGCTLCLAEWKAALALSPGRWFR